MILVFDFDKIVLLFIKMNEMYTLQKQNYPLSSTAASATSVPFTTRTI